MKARSWSRYLLLLAGLLVMMSLLTSLIACGGGSDDEEETPVVSETPTPTPTETSAPCKGEGETIPVVANPPECCEGLTLIKPKSADILGISGICTANCGDGTCNSATETAYNCPQDCEQKVTPTPTQTATPTPTPTQTPVSIEQSKPNLVTAFAEIGGTWQAYIRSNVSSLSTLTQGSVYWFYASQDLSPSWSIPLYRGWNNVVWLGSTSASSTALSSYKDTIPLVISYNVQTGQSAVYSSSAVKRVTALQDGQSYKAFEQVPGNPMPVMSNLIAGN